MTNFDSSAAFITLMKHQLTARWHLVDEVETLRSPSKFLGCELCGCYQLRGNFHTLQSECQFGGGRLLRHQCPNCQLIFGPEKMLGLSDLQLSSEYEAHYSVYAEGDSTDSEIRAFHALQPKPDGIYVNFGAGGWSRSVPTLRSQGWNIFAFEPHGSAVQNRAEPWLITSWSQLGSVRFDGIMSNNVLEHFRHPVEEIARMKGLLVPGGKMAHATPCYDYRYDYTRFHLFFFCGGSRNLLWQRAGMQEIGWEQDGDFMCSVTQSN